MADLSMLELRGFENSRKDTLGASPGDSANKIGSGSSKLPGDGHALTACRDSANNASTFSGISDADSTSQGGRCSARGRGTSCRTKLRARVQPRAQHLLFLFLSVLYGTLTPTFVSTVWCTTYQTQIKAYLDLEHDGTTLLNLGYSQDTVTELGICLDDPLNSACRSTTRQQLERVISVSVLVDSPSNVCYEGDHRTAAILAWIMIAVYVIGYPLLSWVYIQHRLRAAIAALSASSSSMYGKECVDSPDIAQSPPRRKWAWSDTTLTAPASYASGPAPILGASALMVPQVVVSPRSVVIPPPTLQQELASGDDIAVAAVSSPSALEEGRLPVPPPVLAAPHWKATTPALVGITDTGGAEQPVGSVSVHSSPGRASEGLPLAVPHTMPRRTSIRLSFTMQRDTLLWQLRGLKSFLNRDYRPSMYAFLQLNMLLLLCIQCIGFGFSGASTVALQIIKLTLMVLVLGVMFVLTAIFRPFRHDAHVAKFVQVYGILLAVMESVTNCVNGCVRIVYPSVEEGGNASGPLMQLLATVCYMTFVASIGLFLIIIVGYGTVLREATSTHKSRKPRPGSHGSCGCMCWNAFSDTSA